MTGSSYMRWEQAQFNVECWNFVQLKTVEKYRTPINVIFEEMENKNMATARNISV
jgi:hypothetical protein